MIKVATNEEIDELVHEQLQKYKDNIATSLNRQYLSNQKISRDEIISLLNEVYKTDFEPYFFEVREVAERE